METRGAGGGTPLTEGEVPGDLSVTQGPSPISRGKPPVAKCSQPNDSPSPTAPIHARFSQRLEWWKKHAPPHILRLITQGLRAGWESPPLLSFHHRVRSQGEEARCADILREYENIGAAQLLPENEAALVEYLVPWFLIEKPTKMRLILNCKNINRFIPLRYFRLENWPQVFPFLERGMWGGKIDLSNAYFHLPLHPSLAKFMNVRVGEKTYRFTAAPFGLNILPFTWQDLMRVFERKWRGAGVICFVYIDDILVLAPTQTLAQQHLDLVFRDLVESGAVVNWEKSVLEAT